MINVGGRRRMKIRQNECYRLEQLSILFELFEYSIGDFEDECATFISRPDSETRYIVVCFQPGS